MTIRVAFSTLGCPDWSWHDLLQKGKRYGYDGVEIRLIARETDLLKVPELRPQELALRRRELADAGFLVCGLASSVRFDDADPADRGRQLETGRAYIDLAQELGAGFVRVFGDVLPAAGGEAERDAAMQQIADGLETLGDYASRQKIFIVIETHGDFSDSRIIERTLERVECPAVGVLWDTHHPWRFFGEDPAETFERLRRWVRHTHWKDSVNPTGRALGQHESDAAARAHRLMSGHRHADYVLFGGGEFPAAQCMRLLLESGYGGWFSLEWEKMWHPEIEDPEIALPLFPDKIRWLAERLSPDVPSRGPI